MRVHNKYESLKNKFSDKGLLQDFYWLVLPPPLFDNSRLMGTVQQNIESYYECVEKVYGEEWDYWNTYIDYQNYKKEIPPKD